MPTVRRRIPATRRGLSKAELDYLYLGPPWRGIFADMSDAEIRAVYLANRDDVIAAGLHRELRCWAFWAWDDVPEHLRVLPDYAEDPRLILVTDDPEEWERICGARRRVEQARETWCLARRWFGD